MAVLYRKYRPQTFEQVLSQKPITQTLKNQVAGGSVAHAYLFTGSRGVGKTSVARILAKAVNCVGSRQYTVDSIQKGDACGECSVCKQIEIGNFIDLVEIDAASNTGVDNIRQLIEHVRFSPSAGKYKVFIIDEVHMLSKGAFNALLKTLEEPPKHAIFILATTEINKVPATIVSRTQRFDFKALEEGELLSHLEKICVEEKIDLGTDVLELVSQNAEGSVRDALSLLDKLLTLGNNPKLEDCQLLLGITDVGLCENLLEMLSLGQTEKLPQFFERVSKTGLDYLVFNRDFLEYLRKALVYKASEGQITFGLRENHLLKLTQLANGLLAADLIFITRLFLKAYKDLASSPFAEIPMLLASIEGAMRKSTRVESVKLKVESEALPETQSVSVVQAKVVEETTITETHDEITFEEAESLWPKVVAKIKEINGPLASMLKNCIPHSVAPGKITIAVKFIFDKQSLENPKNFALLSSAIEELSGKRIGISAQVIKAEIKEKETAEVLNDALKVFGGELVE